MKLLGPGQRRFKDEMRTQFAQAVQHAAAYCLQASNVLSRAQVGNRGWAIPKTWFADANTSRHLEKPKLVAAIAPAMLTLP